MKFKIFTLFPNFIDAFKDYSIVKQGIKKGLVSIEIINIRDYTPLKHKQVDDEEYGGSPGMLLRVEPLYYALEQNLEKNDYVIYPSPNGDVFTQEKVLGLLNKKKNISIICGHYKGIDNRIIEKYVDEEISIGDYIISGGEIAALVIMDSIIRLIDGVINTKESALEDAIMYDYLLDTPRYTRPRNFSLLGDVPKILLTGNHKEIKKWQLKNRILKTLKNRPDLYSKFLTKIITKKGEEDENK